MSPESITGRPALFRDVWHPGSGAPELGLGRGLGSWVQLPSLLAVAPPRLPDTGRSPTCKDAHTSPDSLYPGLRTCPCLDQAPPRSQGHLRQW